MMTNMQPHIDIIREVCVRANPETLAFLADLLGNKDTK